MDSKKLQTKYSILFVLTNFASCAVFSYLAVFLLSRGLSNSEIGNVAGISSLGTIVLSPLISSIPGKIKGLTLKKTMVIAYILACVLFTAVTFLPLPGILLQLLFIVLYIDLVAMGPYFSMMCMNYMRKGYEINFGLSRGLSSVSYAVSAVILGRLVEIFNTDCLDIFFVSVSLIQLLFLLSMPDSETEDTASSEQTVEKTSVFKVAFKYKPFLLILIGFAFEFMATTALGTYLINIVTHLGGTTSFYGVVVFVQAASEMPVMAVTHKLLKKISPEKLLCTAAFFYILRNFLQAMAPNLVVLVIGALMQGMSYGLFFSVITYYIPMRLEHQDEMMGQTLINIITTGAGCMIGNYLGGFIQDSAFGLNGMFLFVEAVTVIGVIIVWTTVILTSRRNKGKQETI